MWHRWLLVLTALSTVSAANPYRQWANGATACYRVGSNITIAMMITSPQLAEHASTFRKLAICQRMSLAHYAALHHIDVCVFEFETPLDPTRAPSWSKSLLVRMLLQITPYVFMMDADTIIVNPDVSPAKLSTMLAHRNLMMTSEMWDVDSEYPADASTSAFNAGVQFWRADRWTDRFLSDTYTLQYADLTDGWWEQRAFLNYRQKNTADFVDHVLIVPKRVFNMHWQQETSSTFVVHYAGYGDEKWERIISRTQCTRNLQ